MRYCLLLIFLCTVLTPASAQDDFGKIWQQEQQDRSRINNLIRPENATPEQIRQGIAELLKLLEFVSQPHIKALKGGDGLPTIYFQRNDILIDLVNGHAKLGDKEAVLKHIRELKDSLKSSVSPTQGAQAQVHLYSYYAQNLAGNSYVKKLLPHAEIEKEIAAIGNLDPHRVFRTYPYPTDDSESLTAADRAAGLSLLWSEAKYNFANFDLVPELNWNTLYQTYLPKVIEAKTRLEYYRLLREFMAHLRDSHTDIGLPRSLRETHEVPVALQTELIEGRVIVTQVLSDQVSKLGVQIGQEILQINDVEVHRYAKERWGKLLSCSTPQDREVRTYQYMLLRGPKTEPVRLTLRDGKGITQQMAVPRNLPFTRKAKPYEFRMLENEIAYVGFHTCGNDVPSEQFAKDLPQIRKAKGLIIDVRQNDGGDSGVGYAILRHLIDKEVHGSAWSTPQYRAAHRAWNRLPQPYVGAPDKIKPTKEPCLLPVTVLTSAKTFSAGEDFVVAFRSAKRGIIIGTTTGGSTGQPVSLALPGGGRARFCAKHDRFPDGTEFVGVGIKPDQEVKPTVEAFRRGEDEVLSVAVRHLISLRK